MSVFFTANQANDALPDVIKKFEYTLATQKVGDFVSLATLHGSTKYSVVAVQGVWAIS